MSEPDRLRALLAKWQAELDDCSLCKPDPAPCLRCITTAHHIVSLKEIIAVRPPPQEAEPPDLVKRAQALCRAAVETSATGNIPIQSVYEMMLILIGRGDIVDAMDADWRALEAGGDPPPPEPTT